MFFILDSLMIVELCDRRDLIVIDVNIFEFKLRIIEWGIVNYSMEVWVGRNECKYLVLVGREVDFCIVIGEGYMYRIECDFIFINFSNGKCYYIIKRDDG